MRTTGEPPFFSCDLHFTCPGDLRFTAAVMTEGLKDKILIYDDAGASNVDVLALAVKTVLNSICKETRRQRYQLVRVTAHDMNDGTCFRDAKLIFLPGGRDLPYVEKIKSSGIKNIQEFVEKGGRYFGICAGAYFASSFCEFEKGSDMEICGERELQLYPGKASGCIYPGFKYGSENGANMINIKLEVNDGKYFVDGTYPVYYNGGCEFVVEYNSKFAQNVETIAKYEDFPDKNAIVLCEYGAGKVLLSGVHPEVNFLFIKDTSRFSEEQLQLMSNASQKQLELFQILLENILQ